MLIPQAVPLAIPIGLTFGIALGMARRRPTREVARVILLAALLASIVSLATLGVGRCLPAIRRGVNRNRASRRGFTVPPASKGTQRNELLGTAIVRPPLRPRRAIRAPPPVMHGPLSSAIRVCPQPPSCSRVCFAATVHQECGAARSSRLCLPASPIGRLMFVGEGSPSTARSPPHLRARLPPSARRMAAESCVRSRPHILIVSSRSSRLRGQRGVARGSVIEAPH